MIWLIFAHFIGDWALQSDWVAQNKGKHWFVLLAHSMIWTACVCVAIEYVGTLGWDHITFLLLGHFFCDKWKCSCTNKFPTWHLYFDQAFHLCQCWVIYINIK